MTKGEVMSIDDKLQEILSKQIYSAEGGGKLFFTLEPTIAQIKQAFADEVLPKIEKIIELGESIVSTAELQLAAPTAEEGYMSGQEWYDRFVDQYLDSADWIAAEPEMGDDAEHDVLEAARRAAGLADE